MKYLLLYMFLLVCINTPSITIGKLTKGLNIGTEDKDTAKAILRTGANYEMTDRGKLCDSDLGQNTIQTEAQCRHAASQLGRRFISTINSERRKSGCIWMRSRRGYGVYFNMKPNTGTTGSRSTTSICSKGTCECGVKGRRPRIVGGRVVYPGEWPWIVLLVRNGNAGSNQLTGHCGGTLVASQWILTAAHCFYNERGLPIMFAHRMSAVIGEHDLWSTNDKWDTKRKNLEIEKIEIHPLYNHVRTENDIALLKLKPVDLSEYMKACLLPGDKNWSGNTAWVYGWGALYDGGIPSDYLMETELNIISNDDCKGMSGTYNRRRYDMKNYITEDMMCADMPGKDACQGDSGGSLTVEMNNKHYLAGIVSWGFGCATDDLPGVFVNVSYLREWIEETVNDNGGADFCSGLD